MDFYLPTSLEIDGVRYAIRSDYRAVLEICTALSDVELTPQDKALVTLTIFYPDFDSIPVESYESAIKECFWFINGGEKDDGKKQPQLVDWEKDFRYIVSPINRVVGKDIRGVEYMHWWTFIAAYMEIGDCLFSQIVNIRQKKAQGKPLSKDEREWYRKNKELVDIKQRYSQAEDEALRSLFKGGE